MKWSEALSIASSIATLTGVSLAGMSNLGGFKGAGVAEVGFKSVSAIFCVLVAIGVLYFVVQKFSKTLAGMEGEERPYMWTFGLAVAFLFTAAAWGLLYWVASFYWDVRYPR
ncbi:hypothetical protein [Pseudomonas sp. EZ-C24]|uniref:hypothetical protein n=1 Tax=Pseudomonas sp. EZ-C24 TaxID=2753617 RepID=UPI00165DA34C|nr:hypothetical protein [Pseudomonas sp. EZ-C24]